MAIRYTVTTYTCPKCGRVLKRDNDLWTFLIFIVTFGTVLFWVAGWALINFVYERYDNLRYTRLGNREKQCPRCGLMVCMSQGSEWITLDNNAQKSWAFRRFYTLALIFSGFMVGGLVLQLTWISSYIAGIIFLIIFLISLLIEIAILAYWKAFQKKPYIEINQEDLAKIKKSMQKTNSSWDEQTVPIKIKNTNTFYGGESKEQLTTESEQKDLDIKS